MNITKSTLYSALVISMGVSASALAGIDAAGAGSHQSQVTLQYQSGGNSSASRERLAEAAKVDDYDLQIHLPKNGGDFRSMTVSVTDNTSNTNLLNASAGGPLFYARLPEGDYTVKVDAGGKKAVVKDVKVTPNHPVTVNPTLNG